MKAIKKFDLSRLRTEEDFGLQKRIEALTALLTAETDAAMVAAYKAALAAFDEALKGSSVNPHSAAVTRADERADAAWSGLNAQVKAVLGHPAEARRAIAAEAYALIEKYGNITRMAFNEEYGRMHNLLQDFEALGAEKQKQIFADEWVAELRTSYDQFTDAYAAKTAEDSTRVTGRVKEARTAADEAFRLLAGRVNALALLNGEQGYAEFIDQVNAIMDQARATLAARNTRAQKSKEDAAQ